MAHNGAERRLGYACAASMPVACYKNLNRCRELTPEDFRVASVGLSNRTNVVSGVLEALVIIEEVHTQEPMPVGLEMLSFESACAYTRLPVPNGEDERWEVKVSWVKRKSQYWQESCDVPARLKPFCACRYDHK